jgi:hypothetical protein
VVPCRWQTTPLSILAVSGLYLLLAPTFGWRVPPDHEDWTGRLRFPIRFQSLVDSGRPSRVLSFQETSSISRPTGVSADIADKTKIVKNAPADIAGLRAAEKRLQELWSEGEISVAQFDGLVVHIANVAAIRYGANPDEVGWVFSQRSDRLRRWVEECERVVGSMLGKEDLADLRLSLGSIHPLEPFVDPKHPEDTPEVVEHLKIRNRAGECLSWISEREESLSREAYQLEHPE